MTTSVIAAASQLFYTADLSLKILVLSVMWDWKSWVRGWNVRCDMHLDVAMYSIKMFEFLQLFVTVRKNLHQHSLHVQHFDATSSFDLLRSFFQMYQFLLALEKKSVVTPKRLIKREEYFSWLILIGKIIPRMLL